MRAWVLWAGCFLLLVVPASPKSIPVPPTNPYLIDAWETDDGLPENSATSLVQTPDGYLWFGTFNGLVRFDGVRFTIFDPSNTPGLPSPTVVTLHLDKKSRLWISTDKGLVRKDGAEWVTYGPAQGWTSSLVRNFAESPSGELVVASFDGRIYRLAGERFDELTKPVASNADSYAVYFDSQQRLWAANKTFYGRHDGRQWQPSELQWTPDNYQHCGPGLDGTLLVLRSNRLERYEDGRRVSQVPLARPAGDLWHLREEPGGRVWCASYRDGLDIIELDGSLTHYGVKEGLTYEGLRFTYQDREGNIWVGSSGGGLMRFKRRNFVSIGVEHGLPNRVIKSVSSHPSGSVIAGTHGSGLAMVGSEGAAPWIGGIEPPDYVWSTLTDSRERTWVGRYALGLWLNETNQSRQLIEGVQGRAIYALFEDAQHDIWVGSDDWVARVRDGQTRQFELGSGMRRSARCFAQNPLTGELVVGTYGSGVWIFDPRLEAWRQDEILQEEEVWALHFDEQGALWIGTAQHGLIRLKDRKTSMISEAEGLPSRSISAILDDGLGHFWLGSNQGIIRVAKTEIIDLTEGRRDTFSPLIFNLSDGLASIEGAGGYQPTAARDSAGRLWFATLKGVVWTDPKSLYLNNMPPPVLIDEALADGARLGTAKERSAFRLHPGSRGLTISYSALSFTAPEKVRFQYQLEGLDTDWVDVGARRTAFYTDLKPGNYTFKVRAANNDGVWSTAPAQMGFVMSPFFWQTLWFRGLLALGIGVTAGGIVWSLSRNRVRREIERLEQENTLSQLRMRLASVLENTSDYVAFSDSKHRIIYINPAGRKLLSLAPDVNLESLQISQFFPPETYRELEDVGYPIAFREGVWTGESVVLRPDGEQIPVSQVMIIHKKPDGTLDFTALISRDLSASKQAEEALRSSEERFRRIAENLQDVLWIIDPATQKLNYVSPAYERIWRRPVQALYEDRSRFMEAIHRDDRAAMRRMFIAVADGECATLEYRIVRGDGEVRWIRDRAFPIHDDAGKLLLVAGIAEDFTDRKLQEEHREKLEEQLRQSQKMDAVGQLAGGIAHDFNNLLTVIQGNAELLHAHRLPVEQQIHAAREVCEAAERAANLTRQLLTFSRRQAVRPEELDLNEVVRDISKMLQRLIGEHIELTTELPEGRAQIHADGGMIEQIIVNLAVNARDAMPKGGKLSIAVRPVTLTGALEGANASARPGDFILLSVKDSGCGILPEHLPHLFEPFFTTKEVGKGTGLGLATVFGIVQQHEGWVDVESRPGKGAAFHVYFPAAVKGRVSTRVSLAGWSDTPGTETILLVEDEEQLRGLVKLLLEQQGYRVLEARSGRAALDEHLDAEIDLLLTDMVMPDGVTGRGLGEILQARRPGLKVIYTSGYSPELVAAGFPLQDGVNFLPKPYHPTKLLNMVRNSLDSGAGAGASPPVGL